MICDFCTEPTPVWRFEARAFTLQYVQGLTGESDTGGRLAISATS
jgi:hypothetical protein